MVIVALGDPGVPLICCAEAGATQTSATTTDEINRDEWHAFIINSPQKPWRVGT
jgi:hypothetical protein